MALPPPGYPYATTRQNNTPQVDRHPADHNEEREALNELVTEALRVEALLVNTDTRLDALEDEGWRSLAFNGSPVAGDQTSPYIYATTSGDAAGRRVMLSGSILWRVKHGLYQMWLESVIAGNPPTDFEDFGGAWRFHLPAGLNAGAVTRLSGAVRQIGHFRTSLGTGAAGFMSYATGSTSSFYSGETATALNGGAAGFAAGQILHAQFAYPTTVADT